MHSAQLTTGRQFVVVLEPGEDLLGTLAAWCEQNDVRQAVVPMFFGAFRTVRLIGSVEPPDDDEVPLPESVDVDYVEGVGGGTIAPLGEGTRVHLHAAVGRKSAAATGYAGHILAATVHYTVEVVVHEVLEPAFVLESVDASYGLDCLRFDATVPAGFGAATPVPATPVR